MCLSGQMTDGRKVRRFVRTVLESQPITDEMVAPIKDKVWEESRSYIPASNEGDMQNAKRVIESMEVVDGLSEHEGALARLEGFS